MTWARATLLRGASGGSVWEVDASYPQARVVVGSAPNAGWVVTGPGIAAFHVELYWDGSTLYVSDPQAAGDVRLNGQPVHAWTQVQGRAQLVFGRAIMDLETSVVEPSIVMNPVTAPRISAPLMGEATRVQDVEENFEAESTRVLPSPHDEAQSQRPGAPRSIPHAPASPGHPGPRAVAPPPQREVQETLAVPVEGMAERPRLGLSPEMPLGQDATRMVDGVAMFAAGKPSVTVNQGAAPVAGAYIAKAPLDFAPPTSAPTFAPQAQGFGQPAPMMSMSPPTQPAIASPPPMATGQFVPPPMNMETANASNKPGGVPTRTRILILAFLVVAGVAVALGQYRARQQQAAQSAGQVPGTAQPGTAQPGGTGQTPTPTVWVNPSTFVAVLTTDFPDAGFPTTPDAVAASLVGEGRWEDALVQYEALHVLHPERPEYGVMCEVLRRQILQRCINGRRWDGALCTQ